MATQGIVTVMEDSRVIAKIVCGCGGQAAQTVADKIAPRLDLSAAELYDIAYGEGFGCEDCLVSMTEKETVFKSGDEVVPLYRATFDQPRFNPRWARGDGAETAIVQGPGYRSPLPRV